MKEMGKKSVMILFAAYFFIVFAFLASLFFLPQWMKNLERHYASETQLAVQEILETTELKDIPTALAELRKERPMELAVYQGETEIYQTIPRLSLVELRTVLQEEAILLEASGDVTTSKTTFFVWYSIYHPTIMQYLNNMATYQLIFVFVGFSILMVTLLLVFRSTIKPLRLLKERLFHLESYQLEDIYNNDELSNDALNQSVTRFATNLQDRFRLISRNYTDLEYALQLEKERLSNLLMISRGVIHDLKSPIHQTLIENDMFTKTYDQDNAVATEIAEYNIERMEGVMGQINEVLNLLDTDVQEMIEVRQAFDVVRLFREIRKNLNTYRMQKDLSIDAMMPETLVVNLNQATLHLIIHNILSNAMKYATAETEIIFLLERRDGHLIVSCTNESTPENMLLMRQSEAVFHPVETKDHQFSSGTGMFLIRELTHISGGFYEMVEEGNEVTVCCMLPISQGGDSDA